MHPLFFLTVVVLSVLYALACTTNLHGMIAEPKHRHRNPNRV